MKDNNTHKGIWFSLDTKQPVVVSSVINGNKAKLIKLR